jgi:putative acetyltransferase
MYATSPAESVHALDSTGLQDPRVSMWVVIRGEAILGCGALKEMGPVEGEIKAMRTVAQARGSGVGARMLGFLVDRARDRGYRRVSLETGTHQYFASARRLYARHGFVECPPFGAYAPNPNSHFMTLEL